ncbi:unnamed protein product, partial [Rotaria magnacalcarata]
MSQSDDLLLCPITLELFKDPVLAQDGHTYERQAIVEWIQKKGRSPITDQPLSLEHLYPNHAIKKAVDHFENTMKSKKYQYVLGVDVKKKAGRPLFQSFGKTIFYAEWLPTKKNRPEIILLKIDGARSKKEASFYVDLSRHPHIVRTYGIVHEENDDEDDENNAVMLLQEHAPMGSLYDVLQERRKAPNENILIEIFLQILDAMIFLAFNNVVHADLACRNVLVFRLDENDPENIIVKITDFGLSRHSQLYSLAPSAKKTILNIIPTRYVAPEILSVNTTPDDYTEKSDVFSMGVLIWEAYSRCAIPWAKITDDNDVARRVVNGERLLKPKHCSESYWSIICKTWSKSPKDRPTFAELRRFLTQQYYETTPQPFNIENNTNFYESYNTTKQEYQGATSGNNYSTQLDTNDEIMHNPTNTSIDIVIKNCKMRNLANSRDNCVLLTTGSFNPVHPLHFQNLVRVRDFLENEHQPRWNVLAGYISPTHDSYVHSKLGDPAWIPAKDRCRLCEEAIQHEGPGLSSWIAVSRGECEWEDGFIDFDAVTENFRDFLNSTLVGAGTLFKYPLRVVYVCGLDHYNKCSHVENIEKQKNMSSAIVYRTGCNEQQISRSSKTSGIIYIPLIKERSKLVDVSSAEIRQYFQNPGGNKTNIDR